MQKTATLHLKYIYSKFYVKPARFLITLDTLDLKETRGMEVWHVQTRPSTNIHLSFRYVGINTKPLEDPHYAWGPSQWNEMYNIICFNMVKVSKFQNKFMKSYLGRNDDFISSFWNLLIFSRQWRKKWRYCRLGHLNSRLPTCLGCFVFCSENSPIIDFTKILHNIKGT